MHTRFFSRLVSARKTKQGQSGGGLSCCCCMLLLLHAAAAILTNTQEHFDSFSAENGETPLTFVFANLMLSPGASRNQESPIPLCSMVSKPTQKARFILIHIRTFQAISGEPLLCAVQCMYACMHRPETPNQLGDVKHRRLRRDSRGAVARPDCESCSTYIPYIPRRLMGRLYSLRFKL